MTKWNTTASSAREPAQPADARQGSLLSAGADNCRVLWEDQSMTGANIGFALYAIGETSGTLDARWSYENAYSGSGLATGGPKQGFVGDFHIRYFLEDGEFSDEYDLQIRRDRRPLRRNVAGRRRDQRSRRRHGGRRSARCRMAEGHRLASDVIPEHRRRRA